MELFKKCHRLEIKYALTFVSCVSGFVFGAMSTYSSFFQNKTPSLAVEVLSRAEVFEVKERVGKLSVIYDGVNLREQRQALTLVTLKIFNDGSAPIEKMAYDEKVPFGVEVTGGAIVQAELLAASNSYLSNNLNFRAVSQALACFSPVIIEASDSFSVKLLILHRDTNELSLKPVGKIAGVKEIKPVIPSRTLLYRAQESVVKQAIQGGLAVQMLRAHFYFCIPLLFWGGIAMIFALIVRVFLWAGELFSHNAREVIVKGYKKKTKLPSNIEWVLESYVEEGDKIVLEIRRLITHPERISTVMKGLESPRGRTYRRNPEVCEIVTAMVTFNAVKEVDGKYLVDEGFRKSLEAFAKHLEWKRPDK